MINLNYRDGRPIYEQVRDNLRNLVITGALQTGEKLPSVRNMASALAVNPNTIQRAYEALEHEGYVRTVTGDGSFVATPQRVSEARREMRLKELDEVMAELLYLGITVEELTQRAEKLQREEGDQR